MGRSRNDSPIHRGVRAAIAAGVNFIDTAPGLRLDGRSEHVIADVLSKSAREGSREHHVADETGRRSRAVAAESVLPMAGFAMSAAFIRSNVEQRLEKTFKTDCSICTTFHPDARGTTTRNRCRAAKKNFVKEGKNSPKFGICTPEQDKLRHRS